MQKRKLRVGFTFFPYGGNGNISSEFPACRNWLVPLVCKLKQDDRVQDVCFEDFCDTPICMTRNRAVEWAKQNEVDVLVMLDSDMHPDLYIGSVPDAKPFFESSFDFLCEHYERGPVVIGAPYCGPPPHPVHGGAENVYVFRWENQESGIPGNYKMGQYTREEASYQAGIQEVAALPTGLIMYDMRIWDVVSHPYFYYEYKGDGNNCPHCNHPVPGPQAEKCSTEDVVTTRNISLNGCIKLGYNPIFCNWDAWAGHVKQKIVGKPMPHTADRVSSQLKQVVLDNRRDGVKRTHFREDPSTPRNIINKNGPIKVANPTFRNRVLVPESAPIEQKIEALNGHEKAVCESHGIEMPDYDASDLGHVTPEEDLQILSGLVAHESVRLRAKGQPMVIVELGSWTGKSALAMAAGVEPGHEYTIYCVDHWEGTGTDKMRLIAEKAGPDSVFKTFKKNTSHNKNIASVRHHTLDAAETWDSGPIIDFLFIDAGHSYEEVKADIAAWTPFVRDGGVICGHDFNWQWPGVVAAVNEAYHGQKFQTAGNIWMKRHGSGEVQNGHVVLTAEVAGQI